MSLKFRSSPGPDAVSATELARRAFGGITGAVVNLAGFITLGLVSFAPLGAAAPTLGIPAAFLTVGAAALVAALVGRRIVPAFSPSFATALTLVGLVAQLAADPATFRADGSVDAARVLACTGAAVIGCGLLQIVLSFLGMGRLARFTPAPVMAGFLTGVGILLFLAQIPALLGLTPDTWRREGVAALSWASLGPLALGIASFLGMRQLAVRAPGLPAPLLALGLGFAVYHLAGIAVPELPLGRVLGELPSAASVLQKIESMGDDIGLSAYVLGKVGAIGVTALVLALVGSLESMLALRSIDQQLNGSHDPDHELRALGLANICGGLLGALPGVILRAYGSAVIAAGGRGRAAGVGAAIGFLALYIAARGLLEALPTAVLAGVIIMICLMLLDKPSMALLLRSLSGGAHRDALTSLGIVAAVCATTVFKGVAVGVALGVALATVAFIRSMNLALVRARRDALARPSRRVWPSALEQALQSQRHRIVVLELEGALFFGNAEQLLVQADKLSADCCFLVVDLQRMGTVDETGVAALGQLALQTRRRGIELLLAGIAAGSPTARCMATFGMQSDKPSPWFGDVDQAVEHAERHLLGAYLIEQLSVPLAESMLVQGLTSVQLTEVEALMERLGLAAGQWLFRQGDPADALFVLVRGSISILSGASQRRLQSLSPGLMFGELALLDGGYRSADARTDSDVELRVLTADTLARLGRTHPELAALLYRNIGNHVSHRLRQVTLAWNAAEA